MGEERFYSQYQQDMYVDSYFNKKRNGVFIEIGAYDGINSSNSYFFEKFRGWTGLCVEPIKIAYESLCKNRKCFTENCAISSSEGFADFMEFNRRKLFSGLASCCLKIPRRYKTYSVKTMPLQILLDKYQLYDIDFFSLDVEEAELIVLQSIDFNKVNIKLMFIENHENNKNRVLIPEYLRQFGYALRARRAVDDIFEKV